MTNTETNAPQPNEDATQKGASEDPPVDLTPQNEPGKEGSSETAVPNEALENYKQSGRDGEE